MKNISKKFTLAQIKNISEQIQYLRSLTMKGGFRYKIINWADPFTEKASTILDQNNTIILKYCDEGSVSVAKDKIADCQKELNEFYATKDIVEFGYFDPQWIEDIESQDTPALYQFMNKSLFEKDPAN